MKKTLFASFFYPPDHGGIQTYISKLIEKLPPEKIVVLAKNHENAESFDTKQQYTVYRTAFDSVFKYVKLSNISFYNELKSIVKKENIEHIVLAHPLPLAISCMYIKKRLGIPYSTFTHGMEITQALAKGTQKTILSQSLKEAQNVFCTTQFMKDKIMNTLGTSSKKIHIIPPGIEPQNIKIDAKLEINIPNLQNKKVLITVARLVKRKGHDLVLDALPEILKHHKDLLYIIVGKGPEKIRLEGMVKKNNLSKNVLFLEDVSNKDLNQLYDASDVFIMPSREIQGDIEGFGIVYLEAALHGLPVIATKTGGIAEAVIHNKTGILLNPPPKEKSLDYVHTISKNITQILNSPQNFGKEGKKRALETYRWSIQANKLQDILK